MGKAVHDYMKQAHSSNPLTARQMELEEAMAKAEAWRGALTKVDGHVEDFEWPLPVQPTLLEQPGGCPWLCVMRKYAFRYGPAAAPLPGVGCFFVPTTGPLTMICLKCEGLATNNISLRDAPAFLETPISSTYKNDEMKVFILEKDRVLWVPYGVLAIPLLASDEQDTAQAWVLSMFVKDWALALPQSVWKRILTHNREQFVRNEERRLWKARAQTFEAFAEECGVTI